MRSAFAALDSVVQIDAPKAVQEALGPLLTATTARPTWYAQVRREGSAYSILEGSSVSDGLSPSPDPSATAVELEQRLLMVVNRVALAQCRSFAAHAGVVAVDGRAAVLPGASGAGKSTLVTACLQAGCAYVSDEALVVDWDGHRGVRPYPKPLSLLPWTLARLGLAPAPIGLGERAVAVAELGAVTATVPLAVAAFFSLSRRPGPAQMLPAGRASTTRDLLALSFNHHMAPAASLRLVAELTRHATCWRLEYEDPVDAALLVRGLLCGASVGGR